MDVRGLPPETETETAGTETGHRAVTGVLAAKEVEGSNKRAVDGMFDQHDLTFQGSRSEPLKVEKLLALEVGHLLADQRAIEPYEQQDGTVMGSPSPRAGRLPQNAASAAR